MGESPPPEKQKQIFQIFARVRGGAEPAGHSSDSPGRNAGGLGVADRGGGASALVVDCAGARCFVRAGVDFPLFCGAQPASDVRAPAMVVVGGSKDGGAHANGEDGRRGSALRGEELENGNSKMEIRKRKAFVAGLLLFAPRPAEKNRN